MNSQPGIPAAWRADMQQERNVEVLGRPPELFVDGMAVGPVGQWGDGDEGPDEPQSSAAFELLTRVVHIVHIQHGDAFEAVGVRLTEIDDPVVIDATDGRQQLAVRNAVPEQALAGLQAGAPHAVHLQLFGHGVWVVRRPPHVIPHPQEIDLRGILNRCPA